SREEGEQRVLIDWVGFGSIISLIFMQQSGEKIWIFMAELLFAGYLMNMIKRTPEKLEKVIYSFALFSAILALVTQPFVELPSLFRTELYLLFLILLAAGMQKIIWKTKVPLIYICTVISIVIQSAECLYREILFKDGLWDLLFLALVLLALLILSFWLQSKKWFGLSGISLVTIAVYCTRDFWKSISWWIYLMAAGILLIVIAVVKEYQKRNVDQEHSKFYQIKEYWEEWK
ncbi:MAG: hypothetical protein GX567_15320, partial [Clostridia bacterium]|nr:hypothetical protein [Clostridia bacterium]